MKESHPEKGMKPSTMGIPQAEEQAVELCLILRDYKGRCILLPGLAEQD